MPTGTAWAPVIEDDVECWMTYPVIEESPVFEGAFQVTTADPAAPDVTLTLVGAVGP
nr:hypothetical protein [Salinibacterium sp. SWN139]